MEVELETRVYVSDCEAEIVLMGNWRCVGRNLCIIDILQESTFTKSVLASVRRRVKCELYNRSTEIYRSVPAFYSWMMPNALLCVHIQNRDYCKNVLLHILTGAAILC